ncbi:hypothetical protein EDD15DRAFT_2291253 [Pisolithus albus]|nr:hypothetical protein EDD15DRAFT_2291253 [Pisolithus albus]
MLLIGDTQKSTFIGFNIALLMYGVSVCQLYYYFRTFPKDNVYHKCLVGLVWISIHSIGSTFQMYCMITLQVFFLITRHHGVPSNLPPFPWCADFSSEQNLR